MPTPTLPGFALALALLAATGCATATAPAQASGGTIDAINHTHWAINRFSVNGQNAVDIIGPYQGGGGGLLLCGAGAMAVGDDSAGGLGDGCWWD